VGTHVLACSGERSRKEIGNYELGVVLMKRVVTGVNAQGRSYVVSSEELDSSGQFNITVWDYEPPQVRDWIDAIDPDTAADSFGPQVAGGVRWSLATIPPAGEQPQRGGEWAERPKGLDENGFHTTRTIDFLVMLDGKLTMLLDEERVLLEKGDFVVQQATRHAWKNESNEVAVLAGLVHRPDGV
jgi:hypothetical protein